MTANTTIVEVVDDDDQDLDCRCVSCLTDDAVRRFENQEELRYLMEDDGKAGEIVGRAEW